MFDLPEFIIVTLPSAVPDKGLQFADIIKATIGTFTGAILAFLVEAYRSNRKLKKLELAELATIFQVCTANFRTLAELKHRYLENGDIDVKEMSSELRGYTSLEDESELREIYCGWARNTLPALLKLRNESKLGVLEELWETSVWATYNIPTHSDTKPELSNFAFMYQRTVSVLSSISLETKRRDELFKEFALGIPTSKNDLIKKTTDLELIREHFSFGARLLDTHGTLTALSDRGMAMCIGIMALINAFIEKNYGKKSKFKETIHLVKDVTPNLDIYERFFGVPKNLDVVKKYAQEIIKIDPRS